MQVSNMTESAILAAGVAHLWQSKCRMERMFGRASMAAKTARARWATANRISVLLTSPDRGDDWRQAVRDLLGCEVTL